MSHNPNEEAFFREVDEDYRRDQAVKFFQDYGSYLMAGAFIIIAVVAGYTFQQNQRAQQGASGGDALSAAMVLAETGKVDEAQKALIALSQKGPGHYRVVARLQLAAEAVAQSDPEGARTYYKGVADDETAPEELKNFARMQLAALSVGVDSYDTLARDLEKFRSGSSRWRFSAKETLGLAAFKEGKTTEAELLFRELSGDSEAPQGMRQRAEVMLALLFENQKAAQAGSTGKKDTANEAKTQ